METLLVGLAHPDDEVGVAGTLLAQRARGDRVVIVWLTRGEMTEAFGPISTAEVAQKRTAQGMRSGELLGVETRFLDFPDSALVADRDTAVQVARVISDIQPTGADHVGRRLGARDASPRSPGLREDLPRCGEPGTCREGHRAGAAASR